MDKKKTQLLSPLFLKYQTEYEKNPKSRVFAPLAEIYRKLGMTDKAMEILSQGIRFHPNYLMGYLGLAFCYYDIKQYSLTYSTLRPLIEDNRDNLRMQKLFAETCVQLDHKEEALETYKYLLFINPRDKDVAAEVSRLERVIEDQYAPNYRPIVIPVEEFSSSGPNKLFDIESLTSSPEKLKSSDEDDWMTVDLNKNIFSGNEASSHVDDNFWNLKKLETNHSDISLDFEQVQLQEDNAIENKPKGLPFVTHTLVDLYCGQGHIEKALEILENILILNPSDQKTIDKIAEIKQLLGPQTFDEIDSEEIDELIESPTTEEDGRQQLMSLIDETIRVDIIEEVTENSSAELSNKERKIQQITQKLTLFLEKIHQRALVYQSSL